MSAAYYPQVQEIYVAYYGRPADPAGLQYWAGQLAANKGNLSAIINAFGNSAESTALYAGATNSAKVTAIYQQLFNRAPDSAGLTFYTNALTAGTMTAASIALNVADGATGVDATYLSNKLVVAQAFSDALTTDSSANLAYSGTTAATTARSLISGVTTSAATTNVASTITSIKAGGGGSVAGQTFTLTPGVDELNGTTGNDTFNASTGTLGDDDDINGGSGTDTMVLTVTGDTNSTAQVSVEELKIVGRSFVVPDVDLTEFDVDSKVVVSQATSGFSSEITITGGGDLQYEFTNGITTATFNDYDEGLINTGTLTNLNLDGTATEAVLNVTAGTVVLADDGGTIVDLKATIGSGATLDLDASVELTGDVVISGSGTLRGDQDSLIGAEIDAPNATLRIDNVTSPAAYDLENVKVAVVRVDTDDATEFTTAEGKVFDITKTDAVFEADTSADGGSYVVNVKATGSTIDTVGVNLDSSTINILATSLITNATLITAGSKTNIVVSGAAFTIDALEETNVTDQIVLTGDQRLTLSDIAVTNLDASAYTGNITITDSTLGDATTIATGLGADSITIDTDADTSYDISTGAGNDTLKATLWTGDTDVGLYASLGDGNDTVVLGTDADAFAPVADSILIIEGGAGSDTITFGDGAGAGVDFTGVNFVFTGVELITIAAATYTFNASTLHKQTGLAIEGTVAADQDIEINTLNTDTALDLSGITFADVDSLTIDLSTTKSSSSFSGTLSNMKDVVTGPDTGTFGFTLNLGAGNDEITLTGGGGTLTLGAGSDEVIVAAGASTSAANDLVSITDFVVASDKLDMVEDVAPDILPGAAVNVSDATSSSSDSFSAYVKKGKVFLVGDDAAAVDTLSEWIKVLEEINVDGAYAFSFGGDLYVTSVAGGAEEETIRLVGLGSVAGIGTGGGTNIVTVIS